MRRPFSLTSQRIINEFVAKFTDDLIEDLGERIDEILEDVTELDYDGVEDDLEFIGRVKEEAIYRIVARLVTEEI